MSFLDPYDYWKKAFGAFTRSLTARDDAEAMERITRGAMEAAGALGSNSNVTVNNEG